MTDFSFVQEKATNFAAGVGSGNLVLDTPPTTGNVLLLLVAAPVSNEGVAASGLTQTGVTWVKRQDIATVTTTEIWEGTVGATPSATCAITREASGQSCAFTMLEIVLATDAEYNAGLSGTSFGTSDTAATVAVTPASGSKWLMVSAIRKAGTTVTGPSAGWTELLSGNSSALFAYKLSNAGPGTTEQNSYQRSTSTGWDAALVTLSVGTVDTGLAGRIRYRKLHLLLEE